MDSFKTSTFIVGKYQNGDTKITNTKQVAERLKDAGFDFTAYLSSCWPCEIHVKPNGRREEVYQIFNSVQSTRYQNKKEHYYLLPVFGECLGDSGTIGNVQFVV